MWSEIFHWLWLTASETKSPLSLDIRVFHLGKLLFIQYKHCASQLVQSMQPQSWGRLLTWQLSRRWTSSNRDEHSLEGVNQTWFKNLGELQRKWVRLESVHQEPPHTEGFRKWDTTAAFPVSSHSWTKDIVRSIWPGLRRKATGPMLSGPKSSVQMKVNVEFHLEIKEGGRVERHRIQVAWSPVWSFHSLWCFGCHVICWCWPIVFYQVHSQCSCLPGDFRTCHASSAENLNGDASFLFQQDLAPAHSAKTTTNWSADHNNPVPIAQPTCLIFTPWRMYWVLSRGRWETPNPTIQMSWRLLSKQAGLQ